jgi:hypothetical protein
MRAGELYPVIAAVAVLALVLGGEGLMLMASHDDFSSSAVERDGSVEYSIGSSLSHEYCVASLDDTLGGLQSLSVYYDPSYRSFAENGVAAIGGRALDEEYYVQQMPATFKMRGIDFCETVDAQELRGITSSPGAGSAIIILSGSLPDTVYDGTSDSPILSWISSGGRLYWVGGPLGSYIAHPDGLEQVENGASLFLGSECIGPEGINAYSEVENGYRDALKLQSNHLGWAVDSSLLPEDAVSLSMGYCEGSLSTITLVACGDGAVCIVAGDYTIRQRMDMAQVVAACIGPETVLVDYEEGKVKGTSTGDMALGDSVYITLGGFYPMYCERHEVAR